MELKLYNKIESIPDIESLDGFIPIFATKEYGNLLKEMNNSVVSWFSANIENNLYVIPFSVIKKGPFRKGTFLTAVISRTEDDEQMEKFFLNQVVDFIRKRKMCDWIQQGPNWAIFNNYPDGAIFAPFGTYRISLEDKTEEDLLANLYTKVRQRIRKLYRDDTVEVRSIFDSEDDSIKLINDTLEASNVDTFDLEKLDLIKKYLGDNILGCTSYHNGIPQSSFIYFFNSYSSYGIYAGSKYKAVQGSTEILNWETIKECKKRDLKYFDCVGARINPDKDTKLFRIQRGKEHLGAEMKQGYMFKMVFNGFKYSIYENYVKMMNFLNGKKHKGDIIDQERKRLGIK